MAYTTPATWSVGESPTAAKMNAQIRDNITYLHDSIPACSLVHPGGVSIPNDTWTALTFTSELVDTDTMHDNSTNNTHVTFTTAGRYLIVAQVAFVAIASPAGIGGRFNVNGGGAIVSELKAAACNQDGNGITVSCLLNPSAADYLEFEVWHNKGSAVDTYGSQNGCVLSASRV